MAEDVAASVLWWKPWNDTLPRAWARDTEKPLENHWPTQLLQLLKLCLDRRREF